MHLNKTQKIVYSIITAILLTTFVITFLDFSHPDFAGKINLIRGITHCTLALIWIYSLYGRLLKSKLRAYAMNAAFLIFIWLFLRTLRYQLPAAQFPVLRRSLWYLYYLPILFIPLMMLFMIMCLSKPEGYKIPRQLTVLYLCSFSLLILVLTNNFHEFVFIDPERWHSHYYGIGYAIILAYLAILSVAGFLMLWHRSHLPNKSHHISFVFLPFAALLLYAIGYILRINLLMTFFYDMTAVFCICLFVIIEICIATNLIPSNTHYRDLFSATTISALITNHQYEVVLTSDGAPALSEESLRETVNGPVVMEDGHRLSVFDTSFGHVFWLEDVSDLLKKRDELTYANEYLSEHNSALAEEYKTNRYREQLVARNQLYINALDQTADKIGALSKMIDQLESTHDPVSERHLLSHICLLGAHLKRRTNLFLLSEEQPVLPIIELEHSIRELAQNLELFNISFICYINTADDMRFENMVFLYDALEVVLEATIDFAPSYYVTVQYQQERPALIVRLSNLATLPKLPLETLQVEVEEEDEWLLTIPIPWGGVRI